MDRITAAIGSFAVDDIDAARDFYGRKLGLSVADANPNGPGPLWLNAGDGPGVFVYPKPQHVPADFTVLNLAVENIEGAIDDLVSRATRLPGSATPPATAFRSSG